MTSIVMKFAPIGVFCLMAKTFGSMGLEGILPLSKYFVCVLIGLAIQAFIVYPSLLVIFTRLNPIRFFRKFMSVMFFAFSSSTSNATIPLNINKLEDMGVFTHNGYDPGMSEEELQKLKAPVETFFVTRDRGAGRPTKKDRREIEQLWDSLDF